MNGIYTVDLGRVSVNDVAYTESNANYVPSINVSLDTVLL